MPFYKRDGVNLEGQLDDIALHLGGHHKKYFLLFEVKHNCKWRSKAHKQLNKAEDHLIRNFKKSGFENYKIYKFHIYGYRDTYKVEWYRK